MVNSGGLNLVLKQVKLRIDGTQWWIKPGLKSS